MLDKSLDLCQAMSGFMLYICWTSAWSHAGRMLEIMLELCLGDDNET